MEKIKCICVMRDLFAAFSQLEACLEKNYGVTLNEAMVLCSVGNETVAAGTIIARTGMTSSHTSKVIRAVESKGLLLRKLGEHDKRQMYFTLTDKARDCIGRIRENGVEVPALLVSLFDSYVAE